MKNTGKAAVGFYIAILAAVVSLGSIGIYTTVMNTKTECFVLLAAAVVIGLIGVFGSKLTGGMEIFQWMPCVAAVLVGYGAFSSASAMVDAIGYVVAGLYLFSDIQTYVVFAGCAVAAILLNIIAGFLGQSKSK